MYWWSDNIAELRKRCLSLRRQYTRAKKRAPHAAEELRLQYATARLSLRKEINERKRTFWRELCDELDADPWGKAYRIAARKMVKSQPKMDEVEVVSVVCHLFPGNGRNVNVNILENVDPRDIPPVTQKEVLDACLRSGTRKASGLDGIQNLALKTAVKAAPMIFTGVYDRCLREGVFPDVWKRQRLPEIHPRTARCACSTRRVKSSRK